MEIELAKFGKPDCYMESLADELRPKRDFMAKFLSDVGMVPTIPEAGYFMLADWSALGIVFAQDYFLQNNFLNLVNICYMINVLEES